ncbi:MAG: flagellar protein FlaG [Lachnospiraceae bacterium]|nr:flagellar protein FlaG [Lachnospiraceae bacterium]
MAKQSTPVKAPQPKEPVAQPKKQSADVALNISAENKGTNAEPQKEEVVSSKMKDAIDKVNAKIVPSKTRCEFSYHEDTKRVSIKVIDQNTEEVIREIPPEETLDMLSKMWELAGILVDERR